MSFVLALSMQSSSHRVLFTQSREQANCNGAAATSMCECGTASIAPRVHDEGKQEGCTAAVTMNRHESHAQPPSEHATGFHAGRRRRCYAVSRPGSRAPTSPHPEQAGASTWAQPRRHCRPRRRNSKKPQAVVKSHKNAEEREGDSGSDGQAEQGYHRQQVMSPSHLASAATTPPRKQVCGRAASQPGSTSLAATPPKRARERAHSRRFLSVQARGCTGPKLLPPPPWRKAGTAAAAAPCPFRGNKIRGKRKKGKKKEEG